MIKENPKLIGYTVVACALLLALTFAGKVNAKNSEQLGSAPVVTLNTWNASSEQEQYAFLAGVVSMFELEKEWQGQRGLLPLNQSMIGSWGMGMDGMTIKSIRNTVNTYSVNNPDAGDKLVLEVLWSECVQPKLRKATPATGVDNPQRVRKTMESQKEQNPPSRY